MNFLNKMGLCKLYEGQTAEELARLYNNTEKQLIEAYNQNITDRDEEIKRLDAEIQRLNNSIAQETAEVDTKLVAQAKELKDLKVQLDGKHITVNKCVRENAELTERVIAQHKEIQDLKRRLEVKENESKITTLKLKDLRNALAHIGACVEEFKEV